MTSTAPTPRTPRLRIAAWSLAAALLAAPAIAMQFSREVAWTAGDFAAAALLLFGGLGVFELLARRVPATGRRLAIAALLLGAVLLVWINGAVGIIGDESNPANRIFPLIALAAVGIAALLAVRKPRG